MQLRDALELSFVEDAEMVFTTLSSTGRRVFNRLQPGHFETVLIDEAAQASEVTTLQALTFGCRRCAHKMGLCKDLHYDNFGKAHSGRWEIMFRKESLLQICLQIKKSRVFRVQDELEESQGYYMGI